MHNGNIRRLHFAEVDSTNNIAKSLSPQPGEAILITADYQTAGRGQRGNTWEAMPGKNLLFSLVLKPDSISASEQFVICELISVALSHVLSAYTEDIRIKWPNDIYYRDHKLCGILIEHDLEGSHLSRTLIGVGLNVNQTEFPADLPNPTSMALRCRREFDREEVLRGFMRNLQQWYDILASGDKQLVEHAYISRMYHLGEEHSYMLPSGEIIRARIRGVKPSGELRLEHADGTVSEYAFKEIEFVLPHKQAAKKE